MFLSKVEVAWPMARNPYDIHRAIWGLFPGEPREARGAPNKTRGGFLFRVESSRAGRPAQLLVQSRRAPQARADHATLIATRELHPMPQVGQQLAFLLTANPIKTIDDETGRTAPTGEPKKCRVPLTREEEQHAWLARKLASAARVESLTVQPHPPLYFRKNGAGKLVTVTYEGVLRVDEPQVMLACMENGIGPAKGFGCGLLLVRRAT